MSNGCPVCDREVFRRVGEMAYEDDNTTAVSAECYCGHIEWIEMG